MGSHERMEMPRKAKTAVDSARMQALAFNDAVRDILRADGVFKLSDDRRADAIWEWDGVQWKRVSLDEGVQEEAPAFDLGDEEGVATRA